MTLGQAVALAMLTRRAFYRPSDKDRLYRCPDGDTDHIEHAFMPRWEYRREHEAELRADAAENGELEDFVVESWSEMYDEWRAADIMAEDWLFEETERPPTRTNG